jgi:hypothetical protein
MGRIVMLTLLSVIAGGSKASPGVRDLLLYRAGRRLLALELCQRVLGKPMADVWMRTNHLGCTNGVLTDQICRKVMQML